MTQKFIILPTFLTTFTNYDFSLIFHYFIHFFSYTVLNYLFAHLSYFIHILFYSPIFLHIYLKYGCGTGQPGHEKSTAWHEYEVVGRAWTACFWQKHDKARPDTTTHTKFSQIRLRHDGLTRPGTLGLEPILKFSAQHGLT